MNNKYMHKKGSQSLFLLDIYSFLNQILKEERNNEVLVSILIFTGYLFFLKRGEMLYYNYFSSSLNPYFYWISILSQGGKTGRSLEFSI
ncbi:MAG: hypothetical protein JG768_1412 [Fusobacteriales bacterium]|nr:hypothetical protein [Fusobacteriales bacterium]